MFVGIKKSLFSLFGTRVRAEKGEKKERKRGRKTNMHGATNAKAYNKTPYT